MRCANCGTELLPGKGFCHACGTPAHRNCPNCNAALQGSYKFCPDCGFQLAAPPELTGQPATEVTAEPARERVMPLGLAQKIRATQGAVEGERKLVTVLFCDLAGSTAIAERLDPEEYRELLEQYVALGFSAIYRFEGIVNQLAGDGVMALFGAPIAHEDAPQRAILAALAIQEAMGGLNEKLRGSRGPELHARIGIHTGPVVVGTVGNDLKMDYTAIGDTTNLASRLESLCPPGGILVSEQTYSLVRGLFDMHAVGPFDVKGKSEPVVAYEVRGQRAVVNPILIAAERGLTPLVGRDEELAHLDACFQRLKGGLPQVVALVGESGSGRSRLVYEFKQRIAGEPIVFEARCSSLSQRTPYYPWLVMMQQYFDIGIDTPSECGCEQVAQKLAQLGPKAERGAPYLCRMLSLPSAGLEDVPAEDTKRETYEAIGSVFQLESMRAPVVIVIEDLHWIDEASHEMLARAVSELGRARIMIVLTHRPDLPTAWRTTAAFTQLTLSRLSDTSAVEIIRSIAGAPLPADLEKAILTKAEGSPFFTEEITRALLEGGYLERDDGRHRLTRPVEEITIPGTVQEVIAARLDRLDPHAKRVVQVSAVMGRQFSREQLKLMLRDDGIEVDLALAELERRGIIHRKTLFSDDSYRFGESLTQEVAYEGLLLKQRRELHERIANLLEAMPGERTAERSALLAHHFAHSANDQRAIEALLQAAIDAEKVPSYSGATRFYREAWDLAEGDLAGDGRTAIQRLALDAALGLARMIVLYNVGDPDGEQIVSRAANLADTIAVTPMYISLSTYRGMMMMTGAPTSFADGLKVIEAAQAVARRNNLSVPAMSRALAWAYTLDGRLSLAGELIETALDEMGKMPQLDPLSDIALGTRYLRDRINFYSGKLDLAQRGAAETLDAAVKASNRTISGGCSGTLAQVHFYRGEYEQAIQLAETAVEKAKAVGNPLARRAEMAVIAASRYELGEAVTSARFPELLDDELPAEGEMLMAAPLVVAGLLALGETRKAARFARRVRERAGGRLRILLASIARGEALRRLGADRRDEAERAYQEAIELADALGTDTSRAAAHLGAGEIALARGDRSKAAHHLHVAFSASENAGLGRFLPRIEQLIGLLRAESDASSAVGNA
jgi:class 3 adenylate cyclase/tetratricopeptide (TPR) repeat protein